MTAICRSATVGYASWSSHRTMTAATVCPLRLPPVKPCLHNHTFVQNYICMMMLMTKCMIYDLALVWQAYIPNQVEQCSNSYDGIQTFSCMFHLSNQFSKHFEQFSICFCHWFILHVPVCPLNYLNRFLGYSQIQQLRTVWGVCYFLMWRMNIARRVHGAASCFHRKAVNNTIHLHEDFHASNIWSCTQGLIIWSQWSGISVESPKSDEVHFDSWAFCLFLG